MVEARKRKKSKKLFFILPFAVIFGVIAIMYASVFITGYCFSYHAPDDDMTDISYILEKEELTEKDYETLYRQTGLTKIGVDRCLSRGEVGKEKIKSIQESFFDEYNIRREFSWNFVCSVYTDKTLEYCYLENGDVIVSLSTFFTCFNIGHSGLVTDAGRAGILQSFDYGIESAVGSISDFLNRPTFIVLSPKADKETKDNVAKYAAENLTGKDYRFSVGILTDKNKCEKTQCAHIVWYAYKNFGIDLDDNGGLTISPKGLANSEKMDIVQVFGFDLDKLWK